jgi:hypothetical protein
MNDHDSDYYNDRCLTEEVKDAYDYRKGRSLNKVEFIKGRGIAPPTGWQKPDHNPDYIDLLAEEANEKENQQKNSQNNKKSNEVQKSGTLMDDLLSLDLNTLQKPTKTNDHSTRTRTTEA